MPGNTPAAGVRQRASGIERQAQRGAVEAIRRSRFDPPHEKTIKRILGDDEAERAHRRDYVIDPPGCLWNDPDIAD